MAGAVFAVLIPDGTGFIKNQYTAVRGGSKTFGHGDGVDALHQTLTVQQVSRDGCIVQRQLQIRCRGKIQIVDRRRLYESNLPT